MECLEPYRKRARRAKGEGEAAKVGPAMREAQRGAAAQADYYYQ